MSKAVNSPTARLLQSSRLFSLPRPLPSPDLSSGASTGGFKSSETATTPYPTHQAIATPSSSLHRGDWGLKRSLPGKKLRGSKPTVRVRAQDTWEHVTSFESAGDHVKTLDKWSEMGIPMIVKPQQQYGRGPGTRPTKQLVSVYDEAVDITDKEFARQQQGEGRWKYDGPWLGGMQEGQFNKWLQLQVSTRQAEWHEFLREREVNRALQAAVANARAEGNALSSEEVEHLRVASRPTDEQLQTILKDLRDDHAVNRLSSELTSLLTRFLDLPTVPQEDRDSNDSFMNSLVAGLSTEKGPPSTHPGAGISHIRTNAIMENHPIHGPQAARTPIEARVVRPRTVGGARLGQLAKLGVAGVVTEDSATDTFQETSSRYKPRDAHDPAHSMDPEIVGGGKVQVHPKYAYVDEQGRIRLALKRADREAVAVKEGDVEQIEAEKVGAASRVPAVGYAGGRANYGTSLGVGNPRREQLQGAPVEPRRRPNIQGFDNELRSGSSAAGEIESLIERGLGDRR